MEKNGFLVAMGLFISMPRIIAEFMLVHVEPEQLQVRFISLCFIDCGANL